MYKIKNRNLILLATILTLMISCQDLDELNINPNGVNPATADLNLLLPTIELGIGDKAINLGFGTLGGVMQHTQLDGWSGGHNNYSWNDDNQSWSSYYAILRNNDEFYKKAVEQELAFHQGISLVMKSYTFGIITDLWGDAPFTEALRAEEGSELFKPVFDSQESIYTAILADLETANTLLSKDPDSYTTINSTQDVIYEGDVMKWRKFANSLALRYYMRLAAKSPGVAEGGIRNITSNSSKYPLILDAADDAVIDFVGASNNDSWPSNTVFDTDLAGNYNRTKMCSTLVEVLQGFNDPRLAVWANNVEIPLKLVAGTGIDAIINGVRNLSQDVIDANYTDELGVDPDFDQEYVGIPPSFISGPIFNMNPDKAQGTYNPHASQLNGRYKETAGDLLKMRIISAAEVHFILAEAAIDGWAAGTPVGHYSAGVQQSLNAWNVGDAFGSYILDAPYGGLESIMEQKWIASWTAASEAWFDYRRTGLPDLQTGVLAKRAALPLRFYYHFDQEISKNPDNANAAIDKLVPTGFNGGDNNNSAWSKMWLLQGTGFPY